LGAIAEETAAAGIRPPAVVVIGEVVAVAEEFTPAAG
jgi:uroporphyrin-III C-methyltransferase/precorrin-2 dehydrogenase/sirohydrochlorin ferrochelatase